MNSSLFYALLMLVAGLGIPVMATLNGGLGTRLQSPALAAVILLAVGFVLATSYLLTTEGLPSKLYQATTQASAPWYFYTGGFFVVFYILTITWVAPRFGVANAVAFVLLGQLIAMSIIDHFGLMGAQQFSLSVQRVVGLLLMAVGVFLVLDRSSS